MLPKQPKTIRLRGTAKAALRRQVFERDGWRCVNCGRQICWETGHMHHIHSKGKLGPGDVLSNCATLCRRCHGLKHVRTMFRWRRHEHQYQH